MINTAVKIALLASALFLLCGMITGVWKYAKIMSSANHAAPVYVDIAHRASFFYSFASLVIAALIGFTDYQVFWQIVFVVLPIFYFAVAVAGYIREGILDRTDNMFRERNFITTWLTYSLIVGEIGGLVMIIGGFVLAQFFAR